MYCGGYFINGRQGWTEQDMRVQWLNIGRDALNSNSGLIHFMPTDFVPLFERGKVFIALINNTFKTARKFKNDDNHHKAGSGYRALVETAEHLFEQGVQFMASSALNNQPSGSNMTPAAKGIQLTNINLKQNFCFF